jgi:hypothetical protein
MKSEPSSGSESREASESCARAIPGGKAGRGRGMGRETDHPMSTAVAMMSTRTLQRWTRFVFFIARLSYFEATSI